MLTKVFDTMLLHYMIWEERGTHGLKSLSWRYSDIGGYEKELEEYKVKHPEADPEVGGNYENLPLELLFRYNCNDAIANRKIKNEILEILDQEYTEEQKQELYFDLLLPSAYDLANIKVNGFRVDYDALLKMKELIQEKFEEIHEKLQQYPEIQQFQLCKRQVDKKFIFNPASHKQVRELLFGPDYFNFINKLSIDKILLHFTETSKEISTDEHNLTLLAKQHGICELLLERKKVETINKLYVKRLLETKGILFEYDPTDVLFLPTQITPPLQWYVHPTLGLHLTVTGRLACSDPNMQQLQRSPFLIETEKIGTPINLRDNMFGLIESERKEKNWWKELTPSEPLFIYEKDHTFYYWAQDKKTKKYKVYKSLWIKNIFIPYSEEYEFWEFDMKQIEARIYAWYTKDQKLIAAFNQADPYTTMACDIFNAEYGAVTKDQRHDAKEVFLSLMYDRGAQSIALQFGKEIAWAEDIIRKLHRAYPGFKRYQDREKESMKKDLQVQSLLHRKRRLYNLLSYDRGVKAESFRQGLNQKIQSIASDIILIAKKIIMKYIRDNKLKTRINGLVHDSIISMVFKEEITLLAPIIKDVMEGVAGRLGITIPTPVEAKRGERLGIMEEVKI